MKRILVTLFVCFVAAVASAQTETVVPIEEARIMPRPEGPVVQLAILLDTSGSMRGLIDQAKTQLWQIVNEFISAKKDGLRPQVHVALYQYGSGQLPAEDGYIRQILPLTDDLDKVSEELFALTAGGSKEYCGHVIKLAVDQLAWMGSNDDLKTIFIAGNEPFTQGEVDYKESCKAAAARGINVNTIFCGNYDEGISTQWRDGAMLADGSYMNIDQDSKAVHIEAPQDDEIARLGAKLNSTYIPYGERGSVFFGNQSAQDSNAMRAAPQVMAERAVTKSSKIYNNANWDLVDATEQSDFKIEEVKEADLPEEMQKMTPDERKAHVEEMKSQRQEIQEKIQTLNDARKKYVAEEMKKRSATGEDTLEAVMIKTIHQQAEKKDFQFE